MNGYEAFEMMKKGKIVCIKDCENLGYRIKNGFIVEQDLVIEDEPLRPVYFDFDLPYDVIDEKRLEKAKIEMSERELNKIIILLKDLRNYLTINFDIVDEEETKKLFRFKRKLSYDCKGFITKFENERKKNYPDVVKIEDDKECLEKFMDLGPWNEAGLGN